MFLFLGTPRRGCTRLGSLSRPQNSFSSKLSISTSSTLHCHTLSPPSSTGYLILDSCAYCSCLRATSLSSRTFLAYHFPLPISIAYILRLFPIHSLPGSILSFSCIPSLSGNIHACIAIHRSATPNNTDTNLSCNTANILSFWTQPTLLIVCIPELSQS